MSCFNDDEHHNIYMHPVKYGVTQGATASLTANAAFGMVGSFLSAMPGLPKSAQQTAATLQGGEPLNELLISRLIRANPQLAHDIPSMLIVCAPKHISEILRTPDSLGETLLLKLLQFAEVKPLILTLARAQYDMADKDKLINPLNFNLLRLRKVFTDSLSSQEASSRIGLLALLGLYNYICVRGAEPGPEIYQQSKDEFLKNA